MKKSLILGSMLMATCLSVVDVEASYTEAWVGKYADQDVRIDYLLTQIRVPDRFGSGKETGWTGSKDPSLRETQSKEKARPVRPNGKGGTVQKTEVVEKIASSEEQLVTSVNPRYIRKKYTLIKNGNDVCFKHDYPKYINKDYPEMGVECYAFEQYQKDIEADEAEQNRKHIFAGVAQGDVGAAREVTKIYMVQSLLMGLFGGGGGAKRNTNDLNIIKDGKLYYLDREKNTGIWANLGDALEGRSQDLYMKLTTHDFYDDIGEFNIVKDFIMGRKNQFDITVLETKKGKIDNIIYDIEKVEIKRLSLYGTPIEGSKILCSLYYDNGILSWFTFPYYDDKVDRLKDFDNDRIRAEYPGALFKIESIITTTNKNDFDKIEGYKLERIPLGW